MTFGFIAGSQAQAPTLKRRPSLSWPRFEASGETGGAHLFSPLWYTELPPPSVSYTADHPQGPRWRRPFYSSGGNYFERFLITERFPSQRLTAQHSGCHECNPAASEPLTIYSAEHSFFMTGVRSLAHALQKLPCSLRTINMMTLALIPAVPSSRL